MQFAHFGVLDAGHQSKASMAVSLTINVLLALVVTIISLAAATQTIEANRKLAELVEPVIPKKPEPVKPKVTPPKPKPKLPESPRSSSPRSPSPGSSPRSCPSSRSSRWTIQADFGAACAAEIVAMAAPVAVSLAHPEAASVPNHDAHPSAVRLGNPTSPLNNLKGPAVASVNLAAGFPGMNSANTGNGPPATKVVLGNGSPESTSIKGNGVVAVAGIPHGVPGTGTGKAVAGQQVNLGQNEPPPAPKPAVAVAAVEIKAPKVISKPKPEYTEEARQMHVEGVVTIHIRVLPNGQSKFLGVTRGLGHGLDESAKRAVMATKFEPATDASGTRSAWDGVVRRLPACGVGAEPFAVVAVRFSAFRAEVLRTR
jgi:protein TonB